MGTPTIPPIWRAIERLDRAVAGTSKVLAVGGALAAAMIMVTMTVEVVRRTTVGGSVPGAYEIVELGLVLTVFLSIAYGERSKSHVRVELVTARLPHRVAELVRFGGMVLTTLILAYFAQATIASALDSIETGEYRTGLLDFPLWPGRSVVALGFTWLTVEMVMATLMSVRRLATRTTDDGPHVNEEVLL